MGSITLKELSAYLPYKIQGVADFLPDTIFIVNSISCTWVKGYTKEGNNVPLGCNIKKFKPLLRPLSDLTKEIEVNGERFIPINKLPIIGIEVLELESDINNGCIEQKYYSKLLEWHFDVFNLIGRGLGIDLNSI
jgi:hypothetical protein